jgi:hypothetical protein
MVLPHRLLETVALVLHLLLPAHLSPVRAAVAAVRMFLVVQEPEEQAALAAGVTEAKTEQIQQVEPLTQAAGAVDKGLPVLAIFKVLPKLAAPALSSSKSQIPTAHSFRLA